MENKLKKARKKAYLSQEELARLSGVSRTTISSLENGKAQSTTKTLLSLAKALNTTVKYLFF